MGKVYYLRKVKYSGGVQSQATDEIELQAPTLKELIKLYRLVNKEKRKIEG